MAVGCDRKSEEAVLCPKYSQGGRMGGVGNRSANSNAKKAEKVGKAATKIQGMKDGWELGNGRWEMADGKS